MARGNLSQCTYSQNASFIIFLNWLNISLLDHLICCLRLSKISVTFKSHYDDDSKSFGIVISFLVHALTNNAKKFLCLEISKLLHTQLWRINGQHILNTTNGKPMSSNFCWFYLKIIIKKTQNSTSIYSKLAVKGKYQRNKLLQTLG